jgi:hypothetical protein
MTEMQVARKIRIQNFEDMGLALVAVHYSSDAAMQVVPFLFVPLCKVVRAGEVVRSCRTIGHPSCHGQNLHY